VPAAPGGRVPAAPGGRVPAAPGGGRAPPPSPARRNASGRGLPVPITAPMDLTALLHPTAGGLALAVAAVVAGAPLFSAGLRALRLRRSFEELAESPVDDTLTGFVHVSGTAVLSSPLFAPLTAAPCAGFLLEVHSLRGRSVKTVEVQRGFRVGGPAGWAHVTPAGGTWQLGVTAEREVAASDPLPASLESLVAQAPGALWWRRAGGTLRLVERALPAGAYCHVVGFARRAHALESAPELEVLRTGTGPIHEAVAAPASAPPAEVTLGPGDYVDFMLVTDRAPAPGALAVPAWRALGVLVGPALSLTGLLYLAAAAERLRELGGFF